LSITGATSLNGTTFSFPAPGQILAGGPVPATEVYTITAEVNSAAPITGFFLNVIDDPNNGFPTGGPGRFSNGNFEITEFMASASPISAGSAAIDNRLVNLLHNTATVTFAFSEAPIDFDLSHVTATGGTLSNLTGSGTTYTATFTGAANTDISNASCWWTTPGTKPTAMPAQAAPPAILLSIRSRRA
jgi:hypothetical protein